MSIVLGSIATFSLYVPRFTLSLVPLFKLSNILRPRLLSIPYWCSTVLFKTAPLPVGPYIYYISSLGSGVTFKVRSFILAF
jgi:hypothetical protein